MYIKEKKDLTESSCQTGIELMLIIAADLYLSELDMAINAFRRREKALQGVLKLSTQKELDTLRTQTQAIIDHIKIKIYKGVGLVVKPTDYSQTGGIDVYQGTENAEEAVKQPVESWHFSNNTKDVCWTKCRERNHNAPFKLAELKLGEDINSVALQVRERFNVGGNPSPILCLGGR